MSPHLDNSTLAESVYFGTLVSVKGLHPPEESVDKNAVAHSHHSQLLTLYQLPQLTPECSRASCAQLLHIQTSSTLKKPGDAKRTPALTSREPL